MASVGRGGLGVSIAYDAPVTSLVLARAGRTLLLGVAATSLAWLIALPLGAWMAARPDSLPDRCGRTGVAVMLALPEPVLALGLMTLAAQTGILPAGGMRSARLEATASGAAVWADVARHLALPTIVLTLGLLPALVRHVRSSLSGVLQAPFVLAARARGVPPRRLLLRGALRVAAAPLISLGGLSMASLLSASLLVEVITGWPGLGPLLVEATRSRDVPLVAGVTVCSVVLLTAATTLADVALRVVDPRIRVPAGER
jgi:peptide/nickel transport system permease protein